MIFLQWYCDERGALRGLVVYLRIEFHGELVGGVSEAAWLFVSGDLKLDYFQVGLLVTIPGVVSGFVESITGILADVWRRRFLAAAVGCDLVLALALIGFSRCMDRGRIVGRFSVDPLFGTGTWVGLPALQCGFGVVGFPCVLLVHSSWVKLILLGLLVLLTAGWYAIQQGILYASMPGKSGTMVPLNKRSGLFWQLLLLRNGLAAWAAEA
ncbi:MAG: hypothetical protein JXA13_07580 [Anaerolineales bacterium]|nr:hypothetical protein [Anaerolineales bacterium]